MSNVLPALPILTAKDVLLIYSSLINFAINPALTLILVTLALELASYVLFNALPVLMRQFAHHVMKPLSHF